MKLLPCLYLLIFVAAGSANAMDLENNLIMMLSNSDRHKIVTSRSSQHDAMVSYRAYSTCLRLLADRLELNDSTGPWTESRNWVLDILSKGDNPENLQAENWVSKITLVHDIPKGLQQAYRIRKNLINRYGLRAVLELERLMPRMELKSQKSHLQLISGE